MFHNGKMYCGSRTTWKKEFPNYDHLTEEGIAKQILVNHKVKEGKLGWEPMSDEEALGRAKEIIEKAKSQTGKKNLWWQVLNKTPALREFCEENPGVVVYGEVYGAVQDLNYGHRPGDASFLAFDILQGQEWMNGRDAFDRLIRYEVPVVPLINPSGDSMTGAFAIDPIPYDFDKLCEMAEGKSLITGADPDHHEDDHRDAAYGQILNAHLKAGKTGNAAAGSEGSRWGGA